MDVTINAVIACPKWKTSIIRKVVLFRGYTYASLAVVPFGSSVSRYLKLGTDRPTVNFWFLRKAAPEPHVVVFLKGHPCGPVFDLLIP
ncbi:hypothetical protein L596_021208 [Steinernema carpocapsae]|uniref:Uncharacterized protein n=1 Tax=Steinernema carpocapsae TaxID=34508 RepID=A0A4U5MX45_STECR|nr:hypothetical protein L596_021208 [Steinernema carpocapsae]